MHRRILLLGWILVCGACGTEDPTTPVPVPTTITLSRSSLALSSLGETSQLSATVLDEGGSPITGAVVAWSSSDPSVAEVSGTGAVTAIANGEATVSATFGAASASVAVTVEQVPAAVLISPSLLVLDGQGDTATVAATVEDALAISRRTGRPILALAGQKT